MTTTSWRRANLAVVARRSEPPDSLDYFPTPPWATRALMAHLVHRGLFMRGESILEPACGEGHMAAVLTEYSEEVYASDIFPYGYGAVRDFLDHAELVSVDWIVSNPPYTSALDFVRRALEHPASRARVGVAMLVRLGWLESVERATFFHHRPPTLVLIHADRVPMHKGRWEPAGKTATAYCWVIWIQPDSLRAQVKGLVDRPPELGWIGPGARRWHEAADDIRRFGGKVETPLLDGGEA